MRSRLRLSLALSLLVPLVAHAAGATLQIDETVVGLDATARISDAPAGDFSLQVLLPSGEDATVPVTSGGGTMVTAIPGEFLQEAGSYRAYLANASTRLSAETSFTVLADTVDPEVSHMEADTDTVAADGRSQATISVTLRDQFGNLLSGRPVELVGSRLEDTITPLSTATDALGQQRFSVKSTKAGTVYIRALDLLSSVTLDSRIELEFTSGAAGPGSGLSSDLGQYYGQTPWYPAPYYPMYAPPAWSNPYAAQATGPAAGTSLPDTVEISLSPREPQAGQAVTATLRVVREDGKTDQAYLGVLKIRSSDAGADLPAEDETGVGQAQFIAKNLGVKVMPLAITFSAPGEYTLSVEDSVTVPGKTIRGETTVTVKGSATSGGGRVIEFTSPENGATVKTAKLEIRGKGPALRNLTITGGKSAVTGETDEQGLFAIAVELDAAQTAHTLHVEDDSADASQRYRGDLLLTLAPGDTEPPTLTTAFSPASPMEGEPVTLTVTSDDSSLSISFMLDGNTYSLTPDTSSPGTYSVFFQAPAAGTYPATVTATDSGANQTRKEIVLVIGGGDLPVVQNVIAEPKLKGVDLLWDPVDGAESYMVYVGTEPQKFTFTLDTKVPSEGASVMGLEAGKIYYFSVTAKTGDRESIKSPVITGSPLGLHLEAVPKAGAVQLNFEFPGEAIPVQSFLLEYGTSPTDLTEKRQVSETARTLIVSDLLPGIAYSFRMTPVTDMGEILKDMAAEAEATPLMVDPLHPGANEPFPYDTVAPDNGLHSGASQTPGSGIPAPILWTCIAAGALIVVLAARRRQALSAEHAFLAAANRQYSSR